MIYDRNNVVEKPKPGIIYEMCLEVKDKKTGDLFVVDFPEYLMNPGKYEVIRDVSVKTKR